MKGETYLWHNEDDGKQAVKLLRRQHAAFVRLVKLYRRNANAKKCGSGDELNIQLGCRYACDDLLAALGKRKQ
jgi:hypothetical protein